MVQQKEMASKQYTITAASTTHTDTPSDWSISVALSWQNRCSSTPAMMSHIVKNAEKKMKMKMRYCFSMRSLLVNHVNKTDVIIGKPAADATTKNRVNNCDSSSVKYPGSWQA